MSVAFFPPSLTKPHSQSSVRGGGEGNTMHLWMPPQRGEVAGSEYHTGTAAGGHMSQQPLCSHPPRQRATSRAQDQGTWGWILIDGLCQPSGFFSSACVPKQLVPPGILLWAIPSFMRAGFPSGQRPWRVTCFHRLHEDAMCTHKVWRPQQADVWIFSVLPTDTLKWKELKPDIILPSLADQNLPNRHR